MNIIDKLFLELVCHWSTLFYKLFVGANLNLTQINQKQNLIDGYECRKLRWIC